MARPIAISCGEPAGIGPEIAVAAWNVLKDEVPLVWIGDPSHLPDGTDWADATQGQPADGFPVLPRDFGPSRVAGVPNPAHANGVISAIADAVSLVNRQACSAVCTAPIHKAALQNGAAFAYPGHTEYLAALAGDVSVVMMLACETLRVVPATIHIPLSEVPSQLSAATLTDTIRITHAALRRDFGIAAPRIAVAGLNPHAGEEGKIGRDEIDLISPTLDALRSEGLDVVGPLSADTMFHARARRSYDVAVCMYHDQALIPIKTLDFDGGVNVTLGLPFVRTSPDHGTAFDIAGKGIAKPESMIAALRMAYRMAKCRDV